MSDDAITVAPNVYSVLHEDDTIRLLEYRAGPGEKAPMHAHPNVVAYVIAGGKVTFSFPDGNSEDLELPAGASVATPPMSHETENTGDTDLHVLLIELKK